MFDILELEDDDRNGLLQMDEKQMADVALFCNRYPNIELNYDVENKAALKRLDLVLELFS